MPSATTDSQHSDDIASEPTTGRVLAAIWDSRVNAYLAWLRHGPSGSFLVKNPDDWTHYREFVEVVDELRKVYNLTAFSFKQIDEFLYTEGEKLIAAKERFRGAKSEAAGPTQL
jgi:hypothetical protein